MFAKCVTAGALCLAAGGSMAQASSVVIYGVADVGVRYTRGLDNITPSSGNAWNVAGIDSTSRLGVRINEDLGGGLRALANFEHGVNLDTGAQINATKFWDRASLVGLGGKSWQLTAGRQTTLQSDAQVATDPLSARFATFNPGLLYTALSAHGLGRDFGSGGGAASSYRIDNSVKLAGTFGPVTGRLMRSFGERGGNKPLSSNGASITYAQGELIVNASATRLYDLAGLQLDAGVVGASYKTGGWRISGNYGVTKGDLTATTELQHRLAYGGVTWAATKQLDLIGSLAHLTRERTGLADDGFLRFIGFAEYKFSRRTAAYLEADYTKWRNGFQGAANKSRGIGTTLGVVHRF